MHDPDLGVGPSHHLHHHHHSDFANHELIPVFQSAGDLTLPTQPPPLIVDPIITSIAAVAAAAATAALTSLKSEEAESGLTNRTLTTTTTITTPKRLSGAGGEARALKLDMANNTKKNVIKSMAYGAVQGNINSVSISDNSISISQSLADDGQSSGGVTTASKSSQTPKSTKKKTATATATITKQIPSHCSGGESGGLITTSATITGEADCSLVSSDVDGDGGTVSSMGSTLVYGNGKSTAKVGNRTAERDGGHGDEEENDEDDEEDIDELVNGSGENLVETANSPRSRKGKQSKPKKLKPASKTKNPRSNNNSSSNNNNNSNNSNHKNHKQLKTNFDDIAADRDSLNEPSGSGTSAPTKAPGLRNRWHGCPELHKAMAGVTYIADHTRKEEESTRVSEWPRVPQWVNRKLLIFSKFSANCYLI